MTNKPMLSVERELLESLAAYVADSPNAIIRARSAQLRVLLDAQHAVCSNGILCQNSKCAECGGNGAYKPAAWARDMDYRPEELGSPETEPAAQHQGEPAADERALYDAWRKSNLGYVQPFNKYAWSAWEARASLAEQPAPVSMVIPERELYTKYLVGVIPHNANEVNAYKDGWNTCLEEVARLNGVKP